MWILRYVAFVSPSGPMWTLVFAPRSPPVRSENEPATRSIPSSRAIDLAQSWVAPSYGSAPAIVCSGVPSTGHFSGSTINSAPADAAARVNRSAASRLRSRSGVDCSWTAAARTWALLPDGLTRQSTEHIVLHRGTPKAMAVGGRVRPGNDALHRARARGRTAPLVVGGVGWRAAARGDPLPVQFETGAGYADRGDDRAGVDTE